LGNTTRPAGIGDGEPCRVSVGWLIVACGCNWKGDRERGALAQLAVHPNSSAVCFDDHFAESQSQPCRVFVPLAAGLGLAEFREDAVLFLLRYAGAVITYRELQRIPCAMRVQAYVASAGREFDGIAQGHHLCSARLVRPLPAACHPHWPVGGSCPGQVLSAGCGQTLRNPQLDRQLQQALPCHGTLTSLMSLSTSAAMSPAVKNCPITVSSLDVVDNILAAGCISPSRSSAARFGMPGRWMRKGAACCARKYRNPIQRMCPSRLATPNSSVVLSAQPGLQL